MATIPAEPAANGGTFSFSSVVSFALTLSLLWFLGNPGQVHACKCAEPGSPSEELRKFAAVFTGRVVSIQHSLHPNAAPLSREDLTTIGFNVSTVWKGTVHEEMYVTTPPTGGSCGFSFKEGETYIVYAHDSAYADGGYTVSICSRTALLQHAPADVAAFGAGHAPQAGIGGPILAQSLLLQRPDQPDVRVEVGVGSISRDGQRIITSGFVRDGSLGQTYAVVRRERDGQVVRRWIAPDSPLVYAVPWAIVNTQYTFPVGVILPIPLDDQYPWPNQLVRRFDGGDDRILAYDAALGQWRHVPDVATFQARGYYRCNVTAADAGFFERIALGPPYPVSTLPARADYPVCQT